MKVVFLKLEHFRGIETAELQFDGHALLVGANNVGKSTLCEALDLVLGPDRLSRFPPVEEFDFYDGKYLQPPTEEGGDPIPIPFRIEVVLTDLSAEVQKRCATQFGVLALDAKAPSGSSRSVDGDPRHIRPVSSIRKLSASTIPKRMNSRQRLFIFTAPMSRRAKKMKCGGMLSDSSDFSTFELCGQARVR